LHSKLVQSGGYVGDSEVPADIGLCGLPAVEEDRCSGKSVADCETVDRDVVLFRIRKDQLVGTVTIEVSHDDRRAGMFGDVQTADGLLEPGDFRTEPEPVSEQASLQQHDVGPPVSVEVSDKQAGANEVMRKIEPRRAALGGRRERTLRERQISFFDK